MDGRLQKQVPGLKKRVPGRAGVKKRGSRDSGGLKKRFQGQRRLKKEGVGVKRKGQEVKKRVWGLKK